MYGFLISKNSKAEDVGNLVIILIRMYLRRGCAAREKKSHVPVLYYIVPQVYLAFREAINSK